MSKIVSFPVNFLQMFLDLDLVKASERFRELGNDLNRLAAEYYGNYPRGPPTQSSDFMNYEGDVPPAYQSFALKFLTNEFPRLNVDFLISKLKEYNFHLYPTFHYIFKKYFLCDCVLPPEDEEGPYIYELDNDVKENYSDVSSPKQNLDNEQAKAIEVYQPLAFELMHILKERESSKKKIATIKDLINKRRAILVVYFDQKRGTGEEKEVHNSLNLCSVCDNHYLDEECCHCTFGHTICQYCLRKELVEKCIGKGVAKTQCVEAECTAGYRDSGIKKALGDKRYKLFQDMTAMNATAGLKGPNIYRCPFCIYSFECPTKPLTIQCLNPSCRKISCIRCRMETKDHPRGQCPVISKSEELGKKAMQDLKEQEDRKEMERKKHLKAMELQGEANARAMLEKDEEEKKKRVAEAQRVAQEDMERRRLAKIAEEKEKADQKRRHLESLELDLKNYVNKRMSETIISICPNPICGRSILKDKGCNHITCPVCHCDFCYQCRKRIFPDPDRQRALDAHYHIRNGSCRQHTPQEVMDAASLDETRNEAVREWHLNHSRDPLAASVQLKP